MRRLVLTMTAAVAVFGAVVTAQDPARLLRNGINVETIDGDLKGAIAQYERVAAAGDRTLAAQALLRMASCYERLGNAAEATRTYRRVISDFGEQGDAVRLARVNLQAAGGERAPALEPRLVQLPTKTDAHEASLSPDGETLAMFGLTLMNRATGAVTRIDPYVGVGSSGPSRPDEWDAEWPVLSRDSRQLAYTWYGGPDPNNYTAQLRTISTDAGARPRILVDNREFGFFFPVGWAPDARSVVTVISKEDNTAMLASVSTSTGAVTQLQSLGWRLYGRPSLSPDGKYIAYSALRKDQGRRIPKAQAKSLERHLYILAADGSGATELTLTADTVDESPVWTADGSAILFVTNRLGRPAICSIPVKDGKAAGPASPVSTNFSDAAELIGVTPAGTIYYRNYSDSQTVSIVSIARGAQTTSRVTDVLGGGQAVWSRDGKTIAFYRLGIDGRPRTLVLHSVVTGQESSYSHDGLTQTPIRWFPDGRRLLVAIAETSSPQGENAASGSNPWYSLDIQSGLWTRVLQADPQRDTVYMGPDNNTVYYHKRGATPPTVMKVDLNTSATSKAFDYAILPQGQHFIGNISPDGRMWAIASRMGTDVAIFIVELESRRVRELYRGPGADRPRTGLQWSGDSRTIYWGERPTEGAPTRRQIMQIAVSGGPVQYTGIELDGQYTDISPDGSHVALTKYQQVSEVWALDVPSFVRRQH